MVTMGNHMSSSLDNLLQPRDGRELLELVMERKGYIESPSIYSRMTIMKIKGDMEKEKLSIPLVAMQTRGATMDVSQKHIELLYDQTIPHLCIYWKESEHTTRYLHIHI